MAKYTNEFGDVYSEDEINQFAQDQNTTFEDIIERNNLGIAEEAVSQEEPPKKLKKKPITKVVTPTKEQKQKVADVLKKPIETDFSAFGGPSNRISTKEAMKTPAQRAKEADVLAKEKKQTELEQAKMEARYAKAAAAKANKEFLTQTQPTQEYISNLDKDIADKVKADGTYEEYTEYSQNEFEAPKKRSVKINSFQEEKKEVVQELLKSGKLLNYTPKEILDLAAKKYKKKEEAKYINDSTVGFYNNTSKETKDLLEDYAKKEKKFQSLDLEKKTAVNGQIYKHLEESAEEVSDLETKLKAYGDKPVFKTQEELDNYKEIYNEYTNARKSASQLLNTFSYNNNVIGKTQEKLKSAEEEYDLAKRNYGFLTGAGVRGFGALADMGGSIIQLANYANPITSLFNIDDDISEYVALSTRKGQEMRNAYLGEQEKITDLKTFGKASFNIIAEQIPNFLLMYATGGGSSIAAKEGAALGEQALLEGTKLTGKQIAEKAAKDIGLGAFKTVTQNNQYANLMEAGLSKLSLSPELQAISAVSAGQKYSEQVASNALNETNFTPLQMVSSSILYGYAEGLSEKVTLDILKDGGRTLEALVKDDKAFVDMLKEQTLKSWFTNGTKFASKKFVDFAEENVSEQFANVAQNSIDKFILGKNVNLLDNTGDVFKDASILSAWMISAPHIAGLAVKPFLAKDQTKEIKQNSAEIARYVQLLKNPKISAAEKSVFKSKIEELGKNSEQIFKNTIKDIDGMPNNTFKTILSKSNELGSILQKAKDIYNSDSADKMDAIKILEGQYKQKETELNSVVNRTKIISQLKGEFSKEDKAKLFNLTNQAEDLKNELKSLKNDPGSDVILIEKNNQLKDINDKINDIYANEITTRLTNKAVKFAEETKLDKDIFQFDSSEEAEAKANELGISLIDKEGRAEGAEINGTIIIDKEQAAKQRAFNVASHEILHKFLRKTLYTTIDVKDEDGNIIGKKTVGSDAVRGMAEAMQSYLNKIDPNILETGAFKKRLELYNEQPESVKAEEVLTLFSDALALNQIELNESAITKIGNYIRRVLQDLGFINIEFKDGKDVLNFLKDYNSAIEKGKAGRALKKVASEGIKINRGINKYKDDYNDAVKLSKTEVAKVEEKIDKLEDQFDNDEIDYDDYTSRLKTLNLELEKAKKIPEEVVSAKPEVKKEVSTEDEVKEIIKVEKGSISSDKVQKIYEEKGLNGAQDIINLFKPITKKIVDKRRDAPGFDRDLLTSEIETGEGGLIYLIRSYKPEKGVPLAAYINKQLPLRAIAASRRVLDKDFSKDVTEEKGLIAEETVSESKEKPKYKNALESNVFSPEILKTATGKIITIVRTLKNRIDAPVTLNRTVTPLISEIRDEVGKQLDIDIKTMLGGKKDGVLRKELLRNKKYILENMTTTWLMGKDGQGGMPQAIQKQIDGKWVSYPDWVGQKIDREKTTTDQAGRTSGAELVRRLPNVNNNVSNEDFLAQIIGPDGNPIRGRKESLSKAMAEEGAFDIINNDLENQGPIYEALATNQTRLGVEILENFPATFQKDSDRGNAKYSITFNNFDQEQKDYIYGESYKLADELSNINYSLRPTREDILKVLQKVYSNGLISDDELKALSKDIFNYYTPILAPVLKTQDTDYVKNFIEKSLERNSNKLDDAVKQSDKTFTDYFTKEETLREALSFTSKFMSNLGKKYKGKELSSRIIKMGTFLASQAQIGDDSFVIKDNKLERQEPRMKKDKFGNLVPKDTSYQLFSNKASFWAFAKNALGENAPETFGQNRKGYIKDSAKDVFKNQNNKEYLKNKKETEIENQNFLFELLDWYYDPANEVSIPAQTMLWASLNSNNQTPLRKAGTLTWIFDPTSGLEDTMGLRYEHLKSVDKTKFQLFKLFKDNTNTPKDQKKKLFNDIMSDYEVAIIPIRMDKLVSSKGFQREGIAGDEYKGDRYYNIVTVGNENLYSLKNLDPNAKVKTLGEGFVKFSKSRDFQNEINIDAITNSLLKRSMVPKGISVFDFDDTVGLTKSNVLYTMPDGSTGKLTGEQFAKEGATLLEEGAVFDFSEFSKVVEGKPGPMVEKMKKMISKFGPENFFILTARPANAAGPIHEFLSSIGINIPLENITGLGNSTAQAKADWMVAKAAEGYNDFYFSDDAIQNVKAVKDALDVLDVKSKIQQARAKFSKTLSEEFNKIIEENKGIEEYKVFSDIGARRRGAKKNRFDLYVPPSAADFELLLYKFIGKGTRGEEQKEFFTKALLDPYTDGLTLMESARQSIKNEYKKLLKAFPEVSKILEDLTPDGEFTYDQAIRVAMWSEGGKEIPGISKRDKDRLTSLVENDPELNDFKNGLTIMGRQGIGWVEPLEYWDANTIISDLYNITEGDGRKKFLGEFIENVNEIFGEFKNGKLEGPNINKVEAVYGTNVREALEDVIYRMMSGKNKSFSKDRETSAWNNWVNGSTGTIMFLNTRSAALQLLGAVNFLNFRDNNPYAAAKAFANQPQYWKDFAYIWNSNKMKERRGGLKEDVAASEIANAAAGSKNKVNAVVSYLLKIGYTPTQLADSFAIASGGAPFYRNRIKSYQSEYEGLDEDGKLKRKYTDAEAEKLAWKDFSKVSDETQQSGDPRDISKQQASPAGRLLLTFQNTSMQQARIVKKAILDLKNRRGDDRTNISKIVYYLTVQNIMFATLQQGLFALFFDEDEDDEKKVKKKTSEEKALGIADDVLDTILRGSGFIGGITATLKNMVLKYNEEVEKEYKADYAKVVLEGANISPPIGSKLKKLYSGFQQTKYDKDLIERRGWGVMQDGRVHLGPMYGVTGKVVEATTNLPVDRLVNKIENVSQAFNSKNAAWQRVMSAMGWNAYNTKIDKTAGDEAIIQEAKKQRKEEARVKGIETRLRRKDSIRNLPPEERLKIKKEEALKRRSKRKERIERERRLRRLGASTK